MCSPEEKLLRIASHEGHEEHGTGAVDKGEEEGESDEGHAVIVNCEVPQEDHEYSGKKTDQQRNVSGQLRLEEESKCTWTAI